MALQGQFGLADSGLNIAQISRGLIKACTSDGVTSTTLRFLDAFGARFAVSPRLCSQVREVCSRDQQTLLGNLKIAVGYSRGDAPSVLAKSTAGLSAIAFIIVATEMFLNNEDIAWIMTEMTTGKIPVDIVLPSAREIDDCIVAVQTRSSAFSFCHHYANMVTAIRRCRLGAESPGRFENLVGLITPAAAIPLLRCIMSCLSDDTVHVCVKGQDGMGILAAAVSWWYPSTVEIRSDGILIWPCGHERPKCSIDIIKSGTKTEWWQENRLQSLEPLIQQLRMDGLTDARYYGDKWLDLYQYHPISGLVPGVLGSLGFQEGNDLNTVCSLVATVAQKMANQFIVMGSEPHYLNKLFVDYLGGYPDSMIRINKSLLQSCGSLPQEQNDSLLMRKLGTLVAENISLDCQCGAGPCVTEWTFDHEFNFTSDCPRLRLQVFLKGLILKVFAHFLVDSDFDHGVVCGYEFETCKTLMRKSLDFFNDGQDRPIIDIEDIFNFLAECVQVPWRDEECTTIGSATHGVCMYIPAAIWPTMQQSRLTTIRIRQGSFVYRDQAYNKLLVNTVGHGSLISNGSPAIREIDLVAGSRSDYGALLYVNYSVRELRQDLSIRVTVEDQEHNTRSINLAHAVRFAALFPRADSCSHPRKSALNPKDKDKVTAITLAQGIFKSNHIGLLFMSNDQKSAMYSCDREDPSVIVQGSCINCGIEEIMSLWAPGVGRSLIFYGE